MNNDQKFEQICKEIQTSADKLEANGWHKLAREQRQKLARIKRRRLKANER